MCGIVGWIGENYNNEIINKIQKSLIHRGPDGFGKWTDYNKKIYLLHRRLSILDTSKNGKQPMVSENNRYIISYNGEVYNHLQLRKKIFNYNWKSYSDTETLLASFQKWGIHKTLKNIVGMFSIVILDRKFDQIFLIRDRIGEKPLYYGWQGSCFIFSSELKSIKKHPAFLNKINRKTLHYYIGQSNIPAPYSIYEGIKKLNPGCILTFSLKDKSIKIDKYWDLMDISSHKKGTFKGSKLDAQNHLEKLLKKTVKEKTISDVPVGAFLSGGIDSSTVVAILQSTSKKSIKTFSIGFEDQNFNEANYAKKVAKHLSTDHSELYVTSKDALETIPNLSDVYCEPFSDSSQIPTLILSRFAKSKVTVALTGDGGDELFCGYNRYIFANQFWKRISYFPLSIRRLIRKSLMNFTPKQLEKFFLLFRFFLPSYFNSNLIVDKILKAINVLSAENNLELYKMLINHTPHYNGILIDEREYLDKSLNFFKDSSNSNFINQMMLSDTLDYLPNDILVKVDRAAMSTSLETRVPFLDHRIVEFSSSLDLNFKINNGKGKILLRNILNKYLPIDLYERPKMGFGIPLSKWIKGPLLEWSKDLLNPNSLKKDGFFNPLVIQKILNEHLSGQRNWESFLWDILMFQSWLKKEKNV